MGQADPVAPWGLPAAQCLGVEGHWGGNTHNFATTDLLIMIYTSNESPRCEDHFSIFICADWKGIEGVKPLGSLSGSLGGLAWQGGLQASVGLGSGLAGIALSSRIQWWGQVGHWPAEYLRH